MWPSPSLKLRKYFTFSFTTNWKGPLAFRFSSSPCLETNKLESVRRVMMIATHANEMCHLLRGFIVFRDSGRWPLLCSLLTRHLSLDNRFKWKIYIYFKINIYHSLCFIAQIDPFLLLIRNSQIPGFVVCHVIVFSSSWRSSSHLLVLSFPQHFSVTLIATDAFWRWEFHWQEAIQKSPWPTRC